MSGSQDYTVGWICALRVEFEAALSFLDERHEMPQWVAQRDNNTYALGRIGRHNVVIATPPYGEYGLASAATVARDMLSSFPNLRIVLSVGIGGGAPSPKHDIRLGDVVVSEPGDGHGGVLQYDFDKSIQSGSFHMTGFLNWPPILLRSALVRLRVMHEMEGHQLVAAVNAKLKIIKKPKKYVRPSPASDRLYKSHVVHPLTSSDGGDVCGDDAAHLVARHERGEEDDDPEIHYGFIASANQLMKDARMRDELAAERDVLCFETEAAGLMNFIPSLVIRGICDYSDSHKTNTWQGFAAMTAAAYATDLLSKIPPNTVKAERRMIDILDQVHGQLHQIPQEVNETKGSISAIGNGQHLEKLRHWLSPPDLVSHSSNIAREHQHPGVRTWFLEGSAFHEWKTGKRKHLWLYAPPGHGKTVLSTTILDHLRESNANPALAFFFHTHDTRRQTLEDLVRSLAFQLYHTGGEVAGKLNNLFTAHDDGQRDPSISDLSTCVESMLRISRRVTVILDALDECTMRADLLRWMKRLASSSNIGDTKFIVTSRPEAEFLHDIPQIFGEDNCIPFDASVFNHNIRSFATEELYKNPEFVDKIPPHLLEEIRNRIGDEANGM
ncbi:ankyrin repeat protein [Stachybotrys elegans]|uniref:Ankyrin repeat protein n=1 Tax=Stachybotrys elegans TaxID=80388 RepID=A0A8K0T295_9HYPO|nr:ankyrin repeat protein [Stachybotrys elegans]